MFDSFDDDAGNQLQSYHSGVVDVLKKRIKCSVFGSAGAKRVYGPLLQGEDIPGKQVTKGIFEEEEQRNLFARCYLEKVSALLSHLRIKVCEPSNAYICSQHTVRKRVQVETGDDATFEERAMDSVFVVEWTTRFLYFVVLLHDDHKLKQTESWKKEFYQLEHAEIVRILDERNISVFTVAFMLHCLLSHLQVFSKKGGLAEPEIKMCTTVNFDGKKALKECALWLLTLSQDCNDSHYKEISVGTEKHYVYCGGKEAESVTLVPGIGMSQLDPRNQEVLCFAHSLLKEQFSNRKLSHTHELTFPGGSFGKKPNFFLVDPLYLSGWPNLKSNTWHEEEAKEESREVRAV